MLCLDADKLKKNLKNVRKLTTEEIEMRKLLELCSDSKLITPEIISEISYHTFRKVYVLLKELEDTNRQGNKKDSPLLNDMIAAEYLKENLENTPICCDDIDDDIYV